MYHWHLETTLGELQITLYDTWVAMRFKDVDRAKKRFDSYEMNQYSGKWNLHWHETVDPQGRFNGDNGYSGFFTKIESVLCAQVA